MAMTLWELRLAASVGGYATVARHGKAAAVARGKASVEARTAGCADPHAAVCEQMARARLARAQKAAALQAARPPHSITERRKRATSR